MAKPSGRQLKAVRSIKKIDEEQVSRLVKIAKMLNIDAALLARHGELSVNVVQNMLNGEEPMSGELLAQFCELVHILPATVQGTKNFDAKESDVSGDVTEPHQVLIVGDSTVGRTVDQAFETLGDTFGLMPQQRQQIRNGRLAVPLEIARELLKQSHVLPTGRSYRRLLAALAHPEGLRTRKDIESAAGAEGMTMTKMIWEIGGLSVTIDDQKFSLKKGGDMRLVASRLRGAIELSEHNIKSVMEVVDESQRYLSSVERGNSTFTKKQLEDICELLGIRLPQLFTGEGFPPASLDADDAAEAGASDGPHWAMVILLSGEADWVEGVSANEAIRISSLRGDPSTDWEALWRTKTKQGVAMGHLIDSTAEGAKSLGQEATEVLITALSAKLRERWKD